MRPVLFQWRDHRIHSYPAMLYVGLTFGLVAGNFVANADGVNTARVYLATGILLFPALAGARLAYVLAHWRLYEGPSRGIWRRSEGGLAMYGGLIAVPLSVPLLNTLGLSFWAFWDVATFTMLTGMMFARVGCLLEGCCAGRPTDSRLGFVLPNSRGVRRRRIPVQLLEGVMAAALLGAAAFLRQSAPQAGTVFLSILVGYAFARLLLDPLREQEGVVRRLSRAQAVSVMLLVVGGALIALTRAGV